jgi:hypothetical protein
MKRYSRNVLVLCAVAASAFAVLLLWNNSRVGKVLDGYRGIPVYDNGLLYFRSYGKHYSQNGYVFFSMTPASCAVSSSCDAAALAA